MGKLCLYDIKKDYPRKRYNGYPEIMIQDTRHAQHQAGKQYAEISKKVADGTASKDEVRQLARLATKYDGAPKYDPELKDWEWQARIYSRSTSELVAEEMGGADTEEDARRDSQTWIMNNMDKYRVK